MTRNLIAFSFIFSKYQYIQQIGIEIPQLEQDIKNNNLRILNFKNQVN